MFSCSTCPSTSPGSRLRVGLTGLTADLRAELGRDLAAWTRGEAVPPVPARKAPRRDVLASVRAVKSFSPELRAKHDKVETLERKLARWQRLRVPELSLEQRDYLGNLLDGFEAALDMRDQPAVERFRTALTEFLDRHDAGLDQPSDDDHDDWYAP